jgi:hypothetical protein
MAKVKSYMNPNIPKPKPRTSGDEESRRITKPMEPKLPPVRRRGPGGGPKKRLEGIRNPIGRKGIVDPRKERQLPGKMKPGTRKKSGDMGSTARNQRFPSPTPKRPAPSRRGGR